MGSTFGAWMVNGGWWMVDGEAPSVRGWWIVNGGWWMVNGGWFWEKQRASRKFSKVAKVRRTRVKRGLATSPVPVPGFTQHSGADRKSVLFSAFRSERKGRSREQPISLSFLFHLKFNIYHLTFRPQAGEVFSVPTGGRPLCGSVSESACASKERGKTEND